MKTDDPILAAETERVRAELYQRPRAGQHWPPPARELLDEHALAAHTCGVQDARGADYAVAGCRRDAVAMLIGELIETGTIVPPARGEA